MIRNIVQPGPGHNDGDQPRQLSDSPDDNNTGRISKKIVPLTGESTPKNYALPSLAATTRPSTTYDEKKLQKFNKYALENVFFMATTYHLIAGQCLNKGHHTVTTEPSIEELNLKPEVRSPDKSAHKAGEIVLSKDREMFGHEYSEEKGQGVINKITRMAVIILNLVISITRRLFYEVILQLLVGYLLALTTDWIEKKHHDVHI